MTAFEDLPPEEPHTYRPPPSYPNLPKIGKGMRLYGGFVIFAVIFGFVVGFILVIVAMGGLMGASTVEGLLAGLRTTIIGALAVSLIVSILTFCFLGFFILQIHLETHNTKNIALNKTKLLLILSLVVSMIMIVVSIAVIILMWNQIEILFNNPGLDEADLLEFSAKSTIWTLLVGLGGIIPLILDIVAYRSLYNWGLGLEQDMGFTIPAYGDGMVEAGPLTTNLKRVATGAILILVGTAAGLIPLDFLGLFGSIIDLALSIVSIIGSVRVGTGLFRAGKILDPQENY